MSICKKILGLLKNTGLPDGPNITVNTQLPSLLDLSFSGATFYEWAYAEDINFESPDIGTGGSLVVNNAGEVEIHVRVRGTSPLTNYTVQTYLLQRQQLRALTISATTGSGIIIISHDCVSDEPNVTEVSVQRRVSGVGSFVEIDTFIPTTNDYIDYTVVAETDYDYRFEMVSTSQSDYINSISNIASTAPSLVGPIIDIEADHSMEAYYLPLDGRQYEGFDFPLSNLEPLGDGTTRVTAVTNNGLGTTVNGVFDANVVGKTFVAIDAHLNGNLGAFVDEYIPNSIGPRYATVTSYDAVNGAWCIVDFEYNGKNINTPQNSTNVYSYIAKDNTIEWLNVITDWQNPARPTNVIGKPISRSGYVLSAYYIREFTSVPLNIAKDFYIGTLSNAPMRIKFGVEERYLGDITFKSGGAEKWNDPQNLFQASGYNNICVSHNVQWVPPHKTYTPSLRYMADGTIGTGVFMCVGNRTKVEWDELSSGYGFDTDKFLWAVASNALICNGTYIGSGETLDVDKFGFNVHIGCDYDNQNAMGETGGFTRGTHFNIFDNTTINFNPQNKWASSQQYLRTRLTTDFSGINDTGGFDDPTQHTDYLPSHAAETDDGNYFRSRVVSANNRLTVYYVRDSQAGDFVFHWNFVGNNPIDSYIFDCYHNNKPINERLTRSLNAANKINGIGQNTISNTKSLLPWEIPRVGEVTTISRQAYFTLPISGDATSESNDIPLIRNFSNNSIKSIINWGLAFQKWTVNFTTDEFSYIRNINRYPFHAQSGDQFKICAWVEVADDTGFAKGQSITVRDNSAQTITTGEIVEVDNIMFTNRIKIKGATVNINGAFDITNGTQTSTITATSDFDPTQIYDVIRYQGGIYSDDKYGVGWPSNVVGAGSPARTQGYSPWIYIISPDLPNVITGADAVNDATCTNLMFEVEWVTSRAEVLLNGQYRESWIGYVEFPRMGLDQITLVPSTNRADEPFILSATANKVGDANFKGVGNSYLSGTNNPVPTFPNSVNGFDIQVTNRVATFGHASYNRAEITWYIRMPSDWQDTPYRNSLANMGNNSAPRYAGDTAYSVNDLSKYSKGYTLVGEVTGLNRLLMAESASSRDQFNRLNTILDNNPGYVPQYAIDEEMLPPNESPPYIPKVRAYGSTASNFALTSNNSYLGNTVTDPDVNNAPDLPKTIRDILTSIGEL